MGLRKAEGCECRDLAKELLGHLLGHARLAQAAVVEALVELLHLAVRAPRAHRSPEPVALRRRKTGDLDRDPHDLLLVEDHAPRVAEDRLEARVEVGHRFEALLPPEIWMHRVALDRPWPDDRDLDDEI